MPGPRASLPDPVLPIVGVGASAGGVEALQAFFKPMPEAPGAAFIVILHLAPDSPSILVELLAKSTTLPVHQAADGMQVEVNHVYVIPPNALLTLSGNALHLTVPMPASRSPIDVFLRSLGEQRGPHAVGIILSGTGSDGTAGLKVIKEHGGMVMAQSIESARHDSMPRSAIALGLVDHILPVEELAGRLVEYLAHLRHVRSAQERHMAGPEISETELRKICAHLHRRTGHDFSRYKRATLIRRILRRMNVLHVGSLDEYNNLLGLQPGEVQQLFSDLLIGVTQFFRDPECFAALAAKVIPNLLGGKDSSDQVRVWVPGCASGEEAYSIAMLLREAIPPGGPALKLFATDIDAQAIEVARGGCYPANIAEQVAPERRARFFTREPSGYRIVKELRETCLFSVHNLISDPPFPHLDLISCRNLLIYLEGELQETIFPLLHFALRPGGYLFLGPSETANVPELFQPLDKEHRIYQRKDGPVPLVVPFFGTHRTIRRSLELPQRAASSPQDSVRVFERIVLERYAPPGIIVNPAGDILFVSGRTGRYLELSAGVTSINAIDMVRRDLRADLHRALREAVKTRGEVVQRALLARESGEVQRLDLVVRPLREFGPDAELFMILFQETGAVLSEIEVKGAGLESRGSDSLAQALEDELRATKEHLQTTIAELGSSNEEFKSTNEELLATNEELQSANEELQTSREELQSVNEELQTVNTELGHKLEELDRANGDLQNYFASTQIATIFLDNQGRIQKFSPAAGEVFRLIDSDLRRPLTDITATVASDDLGAEIQGVLETLTPRARQVRRVDADVWYLRSIRPYRTLENAIGGVVMTFVDVTELKQAQERARRLAVIVESSEDAIIGLTPEGGILSWSRGAERMLERSARDAIGRPISLVSLEEGPEELAPLCERVRRGERVEPFEASHVRRDGVRLRLVLSVSPVLGANDELLGLSVIAHDITERERSRRTLIEREERLRLLSESGFVSIAFFDLAGRMLDANDAFLRSIGYGREELAAQLIRWDQLIAPDSRDEGARIFEEIRSQGRCLPREIQCLHRGGERFWAMLGGAMLKGGSEGVALLLDMSERKHAEMLVSTDRRKDEFLAMLGHELRNPLAPIRNAVDVLLGSPAEETTRLRAMKIIERQVHHLARLIDDLLDLSRISHGKILLRKERVELVRLIRMTTENYEAEAQLAGVPIELALPEPPIWIHADPTRLSQSIANVVSNALKFSPRGARIFISLEKAPGDRALLLRIHDTGMGMTPEILAKLFEPFVQGAPAAERGGLGLGLALSKRLVELHGGRLEARSEGPGQGSEFLFHLPLEEPSAAAVASPAADGQPRRVLVIEDNEDAAETLRMVLELAGHEVFVAGTGAAGIEEARARQPDVALCDINLPGAVSGYEVARSLRADPGTASIYLAAVTGYGMGEDRRRTLETGFDVHLIKPTDPAALRSLVGRVPVRAR